MGLPDKGEMNMYGYQAPYAHNYGRTTQNGFGGINAALSADNGEVLSLLDMCSDNYPLLSTRPQRWRCGKCPTDIIGSTVYDGADVCVYMPSGFYNYCFHIWNRDYPYNTGTNEHHVELATCGNYIIIMPHMMAFDLRCRSTIEITTDEFIQEKWARYSEGQLFEVRGGYPVSESGVIKEIEGLYQMKNGAPDYLGAVFFDMKNTVSYPFTISNGSYAGEPATGNKLTFNPSQDEAVNAFRHVFRVGDSIKISKCTHEQCNKTVVVREIGDSGELIFDDNTFEMPDGATSFNETNAVVERNIPELDIIFTHDNRVWGAKRQNIYCSKAGDPLIWSDYESLADGCWWADTGCPDLYKIQGGCSYTYPRFFSEKHIYTVYGDTPENFTIIPLEAPGVVYGANSSLATVNGMLIYLSRNGFMGYTGSFPKKLDHNLGNVIIEDAMSVSTGTKYYTYARTGYNSMHLYVYDSELGLWHEERVPTGGIQAFFGNISTYMSCGDGHYWSLGAVKTDSPPVDYEETGGYYGDTPMGKVQFADVTMDSVNRKQLKDIIIRHDIGGELTVRLYIDDVLDDSFTKVLTGEGKRTTILPCVPKRCDHWHLELEGEGPWVVYSIAANYIEGSTKK